MKTYHLICVTLLTLTTFSQCGQPNCISCWDDVNDRCGVCSEGLANLGDGICRPEVSFCNLLKENTQQFLLLLKGLVFVFGVVTGGRLATITHSLPVENIVFMRSDMLYNAYETIWQDEDWYDSKLHTSIGQIFNDLYSDEFDVVYITSYEEVTGPVAQYYNQFFGIWPPYHYLKGTVMWQKPTSSSIESWFGTHFHEFGHNFLVHFDQYDGKNPWYSHWGATGMDRWGIMGGFPLDQMSCVDPSGASVTSFSCQASSNGKTYLTFPADSGAWATDGPLDTAEFSDFELFTMGLKTEADLTGQTLVHCAQGSYAVSSDSSGDYVAACDSLDWLTAADLASGLNDPIEDRRSTPFRAAHVVLLPDSQPLPQSYSDLTSEWQQASDWLKDELPSRFQAATHDTGSISYFIADVTSVPTNSPTTPSPTVVGATNEPTSATAEPTNNDGINGNSSSIHTLGFLLLVLLCIF